MRDRKPQMMRPETAAKKLGVYHGATPLEFQQRFISRDEFDEMSRNPPHWLRKLRSEGPHPRKEVARRLGVSTSGLIRSGVTYALTTAEINRLLSNPPEWLVREREIRKEILRRERERTPE